MAYIQELRSMVGHRPLILVGVAVMVFDDQQRLLLQHRTDDGTWDFPSGFMEPGETAEQTGRREVREETGLEVGEMTLVGVFSGEEFFFVYPNGDQVYNVLIVYAASSTGGVLQADGIEGSEVGFFPLSALPREMLPQIHRIIEQFCHSRVT